MASDFEFSDSTNNIFQFAPNISDINRPKSTRFSKNDNSILSPRSNKSELNQFNGFSYRYDQNQDSDDIMNDSDLLNSIELGRSHKPKFNLSNISEGRENHDDNSSNHSLDKVTDKNSPPAERKVNMKELRKDANTKDFSVPTEYRDDQSFMAELGFGPKVKKNRQSELRAGSNRRQTNNIKPKYATSGTSGTERLSARLPDISGLSSIFSSDEQSSRKKKPLNDHKTVVSVPLDEEDKALFSAFSSFQEKIDKLQKDKINLKEIVTVQEKELNQFKDEYTKLTEYIERIETKGKKFKAATIAIRDQFQIEKKQKEKAMEENEFYLKDLKERNEEISNLQVENSYLKKEIEFLRNQVNLHIQPSINQSPPPVNESPTTIPSPPTTAPIIQPSTSSTTINHPIDDIPDSESDLKSLLKRLCELLLKQQVNQKSPSTPLETHLSPVPEQVSTPTPPHSEPQQQQPPSVTDEEFEILTKLGKGINALIELKQQKLQPTSDIPSAENTHHQKSNINTTSNNTSTTANTANRSASTPTSTAKFRIFDRCIECETPEKLHPSTHKHRSQPSTDSDSWEEEPTERPSMPPEDAVKLILDKMTEELSSLKNNYLEVYNEYDTADPAIEKRKRRELANRLIKSVKEVEAKSDLIYAMNDIILGTNLHLNSSNIKDGDNDNDEGVNGFMSDRIGVGQWIG